MSIVWHTNTWRPAGVVAVGGAGNFGSGANRGAQPEGKQIALPKDIPCVIAAAGIVKDGSKPPASSEGPCYWEDVKFYSDYPKDKPLNKARRERLLRRVPSLGDGWRWPGVSLAWQEVCS